VRGGQVLCNSQEYPFAISRQVIVPETQDGSAFTPEKFIAALIGRARCMRTAVDFDNQPM